MATVAVGAAGRGGPRAQISMDPKPVLRTRRGFLTPGTAQQLVQDALLHGMRLTAKELRETTGVHRRTLYTALTQMQKAGIVSSAFSLRDTRQRLYWLTAS